MSRTSRRRRSRVIPTKYVDAPATIMLQFKSPRRYGVLDFAHTPNMVMDSIYYADDDRVEVIGDRGIIFINRCTARTVDLPPLMLFKDGRTTAVPVERVEWHDSFIDCTRHLIGVLAKGGAFGFTTRLPADADGRRRYEQQVAGGFDIYAHTPAYVEALLAQHAFQRRKVQRCFVGEDVHLLWVAAK